MKNIEINEIYTLFEEIKELVKEGNRNNTSNRPNIELPDLSAIDELSNKLDQTIEEFRKPVRTEHHHIFSIASSKVFYGMVGLCIMCMFLILTVFNQRKEIADNKDNDLKYRYVRMQGEITPTGLIDLDSIFNNRRDSVRQIRQQIEQYEKAVIEKAKRLEKARLKELEAEKLTKEAETLKYRR